MATHQSWFRSSSSPFEDYSLFEQHCAFRSGPKKVLWHTAENTKKRVNLDKDPNWALSIRTHVDYKSLSLMVMSMLM